MIKEINVANNNIINKSGAWYAYQGEKIGQGRENAKLYLKEHPEIMEEVDRKVREHYGLIEAEDGDEGMVPEKMPSADPEE